jgi:hypothetical protein
MNGQVENLVDTGHGGVHSTVLCRENEDGAFGKGVILW